mmetsp:Transcript_71098/g.128029  ORF Transcript_71098/g.128029 Transcript_71098/m.128029 type:complete len:217 (-) Transcript_71098:38-688(-)
MSWGGACSSVRDLPPPARRFQGQGWEHLEQVICARASRALRAWLFPRRLWHHRARRRPLPRPACPPAQRSWSWGPRGRRRGVFPGGGCCSPEAGAALSHAPRCPLPLSAAGSPRPQWGGCPGVAQSRGRRGSFGADCRAPVRRRPSQHGVCVLKDCWVLCSQGRHFAPARPAVQRPLHVPLRQRPLRGEHALAQLRRESLPSMLAPAARKWVHRRS